MPLSDLLREDQNPTMKTASLPRKFLSRREKNGHRRGRSSDPAHKHRPLSSEAFFSIFKPESAKQSANADTEREKEAAKIDDVRLRVADLDFPVLSDDQIRYALNSKYSSGDVDKAMELLLLQQKSLSGKILSYNPAIDMLGAENRGNVTCYLDSLLFAMFAKLESFECMLNNDSMDEPQRKLAALLRLWVNMLRSGKLIEVDMTQHIQDALAACGWREAQLLEQQDTSEAFAFITETLQLPLLTLQVDLFHQGKNDDADHKVVYERLLNLAVPPDSDGKGIRLEDCLEEYFNSQVDVLRDSLEEKKTGERTDAVPNSKTSYAPNTSKGTIRVVPEEDQQEDTTSDEESDPHLQLERRWTIAPDSHVSNLEANSEGEASGSQPIVRPHRSRTESIIQRVVLDEHGKRSESDAASLFQRAKRTASVVKAVTIPAWQFFRLIPWHSPANREPESDLEVARHFSQRPVVGICLKRYMIDDKGNMKRQNTYIDIPDSLRLPHFIVDERHVEENGLTTDYKLVLQSVVCHRGDSLHSGHYISFCRVAPKLLTDNRRHDSDPPPDYEEAQWVKFDDLAIENRVTLVDDIKESLKEEMPYLLFYQIVPIVEVASSTEGTDAEPPSYDNAALNLTNSETSAAQSQDRLSVSRQPSSYFDSISAQPSASASVRFSADFERPRRSFADEDGFLSVSRRGSIYNDSSNPSPAGGSERPSPVVTPGEETTTTRLSRAAARFRGGNKSRPQSQGGEGRKSLTVTKFGGFMKSSREPLRDTTSTETEEDFEFVENVNKYPTKEIDPDVTPTQKRGKSKSRFDKGKGRDNKKTGMPDRECIGK
ncbi:cysteine proteinase [Hypoxylon crocopeplum]|nr:cysteine proteinase [Hypoxylon crocopeplum]